MKVPVYQNTEKLNPLPNAPIGQQVNADMYGAPIAKGIGDFAQLAGQWQKEKDEISLIDLQRKMADFEATNIYSPETGMLALKGGNAAGKSESLDGAFRQDMGDFISTLPRSVQGRAVEVAELRRQSIQRTNQSHERGELYATQNNELAAFNNDLVNKIALVASYPEQVKAYQTLGLANFSKLQMINGWSDAETKARYTDFNSRSNRTVVETLMNDGNSPLAYNYFEENRESFNANDLMAIEKPLKMAARMQSARDEVNAVMSSGVIGAASSIYKTNDPHLNSLIEKYGLTGASSYFVGSIYTQESSDGKADTSKPNNQGAIGPMQVTKKTFDGMKRNGMIPKGYDFYNPKHTKEAGIVLIKDLERQYKGNPELMAAAYYGGPAAVKNGKVVRRVDTKNKNAPTTIGYSSAIVKRMNKMMATNGGANGKRIQSESDLIMWALNDSDPIKQQEKLKQVQFRLDLARKEAKEQYDNYKDGVLLDVVALGGSQNVNPAKIARLKPEDQIRMDNYAPPDRTDMPTYTLIKSAIVNGDEINIMDYSNSLSKSDIKSLMNEQTKVRQDKKTGNDSFKGIRSDMQIRDEALVGVGIAKKISKKDNPVFFKAAAYIDEQLILEQERRGGKLSQKEKSQVIDDAVVKIKSGSGWFGTTTEFKFNVAPDELRKYEVRDIKDIPGSIVKAIDSDLIKVGAPVTDENRIKVYNKKLRKDGGVDSWSDMLYGRR